MSMEEPTKLGKVLVVEDEFTLLQGLRNILELENFEVLTAGNGVDALKVLQNEAEPPDLILSDIMIPHMDGIELLQEVRKEERWLTIPFVFLTARGDKVDVIRAKELRVDEYITKPYDPMELIISVKSRLERHREMNQRYDKDLLSMKRNILTILNHEFRTPLTFVVAYADMLNHYIVDQLKPEEIASYLQGVSSGADRLRRLIEKFILLVELETGEARQFYESRKQPISDLKAILENTARQMTSREGMAHTFIVNVPDDLPTFVTDPEYLKSALLQLLDNAVKFSPADKPITLGAATDGPTIRIWVEDRGRGIPPQERKHILDSFYQINRAVYEDQGAGVGLAIVKRITDLSLGQLDIQSEPGSGSVFALVLPA